MKEVMNLAYDIVSKINKEIQQTIDSGISVACSGEDGACWIYTYLQENQKWPDNVLWHSASGSVENMEETVRVRIDESKYFGTYYKAVI